jgi:hypothetical protein
MIIYSLIEKQNEKYANAQKQSMAALPNNYPFAAIHCFSCHRASFVDRPLQIDSFINTILQWF